MLAFQTEIIFKKHFKMITRDFKETTTEDLIAELDDLPEHFSNNIYLIEVKYLKFCFLILSAFFIRP